MSGQNNDNLSLEKELSCSICTDVLYRPLTLLDCLHTFCGSCLKEWFSWQASQHHAYSCPTCRAAVRDTRPNATLSTLLDMFLAAHPERGKTAQEKLDMDKTYSPGDNVIPPLESDQEDEEEMRMLAQARELSLDDVGLSTPSTSAHRSRHRHSRQPRRHADSPQSDVLSPQSARSDGLSHQSSLRSLLSQSDVDSADMEQDIMRYIVDQGLLDGVDLNNLTPAQEDLITDSIARAFRSRRRRDRSHRRNRPRHQSSSASTPHDSPSRSTHPPSPPIPAHSRTAPIHRTRPSSPSTTRRAASANRSHRHTPASSRHQHLAPDTPSRPSNHSSPALPIPPLQTTSAILPVPSVSCSTCQKPDIQHSLHYNCSKCSDASFNLCLECYRAGKGCLNWYGFGHAAFARYRPLPVNDSAQAHVDPPHVLSARRYSPDTGHLEQGLFCEGCFSSANSCYWHCDVCNNGAWGYCNDCVQQGKHCTHPLASVAHVSQAPAFSQQSPQSPSHHARDLYPPPLSLQKSAFHFAVPSASSPILPHVPDPTLYAAISLTSYCDICHYSIPPSHTRFHCNVCNEGNYDICTSCYHTLISTGKIHRENGPSGWRRCLRGHRMSVVGHEDREGGSKRVVVREMVGGWALKDDSTTSQSSVQSNDQWRWKENDGTSTSQPSKRIVPPNMLPPDGGVGMKARAIWSYFPADGVRDELSFPRNAIVAEVEDINGDWFWGVFSGKKGLFPGNYVKII